MPSVHEKSIHIIYFIYICYPPRLMYPRFVLEILEISGKSGFLGLSVKEFGNRIYF